jgi:hypothetical protein
MTTQARAFVSSGLAALLGAALLHLLVLRGIRHGVCRVSPWSQPATGTHDVL